MKQPLNEFLSLQVFWDQVASFLTKIQWDAPHILQHYSYWSTCKAGTRKICWIL